MRGLRARRRQLAIVGAAAIAVTTLLLAAVPAGGQESKEEAATPQSVTPTQASFASGSGANRLEVAVSNHGNMTSFLSPVGSQDVFAGREGYALCSGEVVDGHDTGDLESGFGSATIQQPTAGKFPVTIIRNTTNGKFQLKQVWAAPDFAEKDVTVTMTLKNISGASLANVRLSRSGDFDVGGTAINSGARTGDSAWLWEDHSGGSGVTTGLLLSPGSLAFDVEAYVETSGAWSSITRDECGAGNFSTTPTSPQDSALRVVYNLGTVAANASKTVKFVYSRM